MKRVHLAITGSVEEYDDEGRLLQAMSLQQIGISGMSKAALADALRGLAEQLEAAVWPSEEAADGR